MDLDRSADTVADVPVLQAPAAYHPDAVRRAWAWLLNLPDRLGVAIIVAALLSLVILGFAAAYGAPLSLPRERESLALGINAAFPVAGAIVFYVTLRIWLMASGKRSDVEAPPLLRLIATDLTLMGLFCLASYLHFSFKSWALVINPNRYDAQYFAIDQALRPLIDIFYWIRINFFNAVPQTDTWYQFAFLLMFIAGFCQLAITRHPVYPRFCIGLLLGMYLGALSYLIAPALGPFIYEDGLNLQATQAQAGMLWAHQQAVKGGMAWIAEAGGGYFTGALAAMPSLHMCHALVMTWFIFQARSVLGWLFLLICFWVLIESVASRWHYVIDLPAGALLAALIIWLTSRLCPLTPPLRPGSGLTGDAA